MPWFDHSSKSFCQQTQSKGVQSTKSKATMNKFLLLVGILTLLTIAVLLTDGQNSRRRYPWYSRRYIRRSRPTKPQTGSGRIPVKISPAESPQNRVENGSQDFGNRQDADEYWRDLFEDGKILSK